MVMLRKALAFVALGSVATDPLAASSISGKVTFLLTRTNDGLQYVELDGTRSAKPACASGSAYFMIRDEKSESGKAQYAMLMAAYLADRPVTIEGAGTCARWPDGEDINGVLYRR